MARAARIRIPDAAYHITARGNYRQDVFIDDADRHAYLDLLHTRSADAGLELLGWCLMQNHVHLLARELREQAMAVTLRRLHSAHSSRINRRAQHGSGHLWQSRFYSAPIQSDRIWAVLRYIELNPVRAQLCDSADHYRWSTARYHVGDESAPPGLSLLLWSSWWSYDSWRLALHSGPNGEEEQIRRATKLGRPWGHDSFVAECEAQAGAPFPRATRGRPPIRPVGLTG